MLHGFSDAIRNAVGTAAVVGCHFRGRGSILKRDFDLYALLLSGWYGGDMCWYVIVREKTREK